MASNDAVLEMVKARLNRLPGDTMLDDYLWAVIEGSMDELRRMGLKLDTENSGDLMLVTDYACWNYRNRDKAEDMPRWLRLKIRERWIGENRDT